MSGWHGLSPFELDGRWLTGVGRTPGAGIGYNRIELTLSGGFDYCWFGGNLYSATFLQSVWTKWVHNPRRSKP